MNKYELFKEISSINQEIRKSIYHSMPKQYRIDIGIEILQCMRHLKLLAYYLCYNVISEDDFKVEFSKELVHLKMLIDESIEDKILLLSGPFTIILQCQIEATQKRREKVKLMAIAYKGGKCQCCGYNKSVSALEFHHIDPEGKDFGISAKGYTRSWEKVKRN